MPEANEEIVRRYFELRGYFLRSRVRYRIAGVPGWSDIDLCGINADGQGIAVEVKGWHTEKITAGHIKGWPSLFHFAQRPEAAEVINSLLKGHPYRRVLVIGELGVSGGPAFADYARSLGVELLTFPEILKYMISATPLGPDAATDGEHMIRLLKRYGLLTPQPEAE